MDYAIRQQNNEKSRNSAENFREMWSPAEVEYLEANWSTDWAQLTAIAEHLGRTIEGCRQKHYDLITSAARVTAKKTTRPFKTYTSLAEMGY